MSKDKSPNMYDSRVSGILQTSSASDSKSTLKHLISYLKPYKAPVALALVLNLIASLSGIFSPRVLGNITSALAQASKDGIKSGTIKLPWDYLSRAILILIGIYLVNFIFTYINQYLIAKLAQSLVHSLREDLNDKLSKLPISYFDEISKGDLITRVTNDVENISTTFQQSLSTNLTSIVTMVGAFVMMVSIDYQLAIISVVFIPLGSQILSRIISNARGLFTKTASFTGNLNNLVEESFTGHEIVKTFGQEEDFIEDFEKINQDLFDANWKSIYLSYLPRGFSDLVKNIALVIIAVWGALKVFAGKVLIGDLQAFVSYTNIFVSPIQQILGMFNVILAALASAERVFEILCEDEEKETGNLIFDHKNVEGQIKIEDISFAYTDRMILNDIDLSMEPGEKVAIIGETGSGKTTLVKLIMRYYDIKRGKISIDGMDIQDYTRKSIRSAFGMVLQDTWLFEGTIGENIAFGYQVDEKGNLLASREMIEEAAEHAQAHDFIVALPQGYDTLLSESASNLSEGQRQLLTIARAFISEREMVILDEATSSVDTRTEVAIQKALDKLLHNRTSIVIAHRLSTIRDSDKIVVLNSQGRIAEIGNHDELLELNGLYKELYMSQFSVPYGTEKGTRYK